MQRELVKSSQPMLECLKRIVIDRLSCASARCSPPALVRSPALTIESSSRDDRVDQSPHKSTWQSFHAETVRSPGDEEAKDDQAHDPECEKRHSNHRSCLKLQ